MILDRIQHYLTFLFLFVLILTQALVYVGTKAYFNADDNLQAVFVEPIIGTEINVGKQVDIQAMLSNGRDNVFSSVYFSVFNIDKNVNLNFEASLKEDGVWLAKSAWDTGLLDSGVYSLIATADIYDEDGVITESYQSVPQQINIVGQLEPAVANITNSGARFISPEPGEVITVNKVNVIFSSEEYITIDYVLFNLQRKDETTDSYGDIEIDVFASISEIGYEHEFRNLADGDYQVNAIVKQSNITGVESTGGETTEQDAVGADPVNFTISTVEDNVIEPIPLEVTIISPQQDQVITEDIEELEITISTEGQSTGEIIAYIFRDEDLVAGDIKETIKLTEVSIGQYTGTYNIVDNGNFYLLVYETGAESTEKARVSFSIAIERKVVRTIFLTSPTESSLIELDSFQAKLNTDFEASSFIVEFINLEESAISTGALPITLTDGIIWNKTILLGTEFIDGDYQLIATAIDQETKEEIEAIFYLSLAREDEEPIDYDGVILDLKSPGTNLAGLVNLEASSNIKPRGVYFFLVHSDRSEVLRLKATSQALDDVADNIYLNTAVLNTNDINNGNYIIYAGILENSNLLAKSEDIAVTIFNEPREAKDVGLKLYDKYTGEQGKINLYFTSNQDLDKKLLKIDSLTSSVSDVSWDTLEGLDIKKADNLESPYAYMVQGDIVKDGDYRLKIVYVDEADFVLASSNIIELTIRGREAVGVVDLSPSEEEEEEDVAPPPPGTFTGKSTGLELDLYTSCWEVDISDANCTHFLATIKDTLDERCLEQAIFDEASCEDYLNKVDIDLECQENNIIDKEQCKDYLLEKYGANVDCRLDDLQICGDILRNKYLNRLVTEQRKRQSVATVVAPLIGQVVTVADLSNKFTTQGVAADILPLIPTADIKVLVVKSQEEVILEEEDRLTVINKAVLIIDTDADGLSDDLEEYYGTDPNNPDSDGDTYNDGTEVKNNYNPLGPGQLEVKRTPIDKAILAGLALEQPKVTPDNIDRELAIEKVIGIEEKVRLDGKAEADTWLTIYLYSDLPLVMVTKTDASGNWSYTINKSLVDGHHRAYVTINDDTGKIVKQSAPLSFLVKEARAVSADEYFDETITQSTTQSLMLYYIIGAVILIIFSLIIILLIHRRNTREIDI